MNILVTGSTGMVGAALMRQLRDKGHNVTGLARSSGGGAQIGRPTWDPRKNLIDPHVFDGYGAVVHLAGENIASGRWTAEKKARIRDSRVNGTRTLSAGMAAAATPPGVLICASAVGYYGHRDAAPLDEDSPAGEGFLADACREWEAASAPATERGIRVVSARFGMILSADGGALAKMLTPFKLGVGGVLGNGRQYISWIALDDVIGALEFALAHEQLSGPVNFVAPEPVTNREFTKTLGHVLRRPTVMPVPATMARIVFGEMADELLLASARVAPRRLVAAGYTFRYPTLENALRHVLREKARV